jgi:hypothetical protein
MRRSTVLSFVDLISEVACFVKKENYFYVIKVAGSVSTRRSSALSLPFSKGFLVWLNGARPPLVGFIREY